MSEMRCGLAFLTGPLAETWCDKGREPAPSHWFGEGGVWRVSCRRDEVGALHSCVGHSGELNVMTDLDPDRSRSAKL